MNLPALYIRNIIFGIEDSLVSTVGLLSGIALGNIPRTTILFTGIVYIFVEAFSMAVGSFLSEESVEEYENKKHAVLSDVGPAAGSISMFISSVVAGFVVLFPYMVFSGNQALIFSIIISLLALAILGYVSALVIKTKPFHRSLRMLVVGGSAIIIGALVSFFVRIT
jgi:VIT1/CCC1 family predicted Fe2+/Mn2+ transporter